MIDLMFLKELMLIRQANQKSVICHYWLFSNKDLQNIDLTKEGGT